MSVEYDVPLSVEADLDRQMSEIIARWVKRGVEPGELEQYQELSSARARMMCGEAHIGYRLRRRAAA